MQRGGCRNESWGMGGCRKKFTKHPRSRREGEKRVEQLTRSRRGKGKEWNEEKHLSGPANQWPQALELPNPGSRVARDYPLTSAPFLRRKSERRTVDACLIRFSASTRPGVQLRTFPSVLLSKQSGLCILVQALFPSLLLLRRFTCFLYHLFPFHIMFSRAVRPAIRAGSAAVTR